MGLKESDSPELSAGMTTATAAAGAVTIAAQLVTITTEALTTAAAGDYTLTVTNTRVDAGAGVFVSVGSGTNTTVPYFAHSVAVTQGQVVVLIRNAHASSALNGTLKITLLVL
jgi:hypothetical protein